MGRILGLTAAIALIVGLSFLVGRSHNDTESVAVNLAATKGPRPPGLKIFLQRGAELAILEPATELQRGDALRLVVRSSAPCYLAVRLRDGAGRERVVFPSGGAGQAELVHSGEALPEPLPIDETPGKGTLTALFGKVPFPADAPATGDLEVVTVDLPKAPAALAPAPASQAP